MKDWLVRILFLLGGMLIGIFLLLIDGSLEGWIVVPPSVEAQQAGEAEMEGGT